MFLKLKVTPTPGGTQPSDPALKKLSDIPTFKWVKRKVWGGIKILIPFVFRWGQ